MEINETSVTSASSAEKKYRVALIGLVFVTLVAVAFALFSLFYKKTDSQEVAVLSAATQVATPVVALDALSGALEKVNQNERGRAGEVVGEVIAIIEDVTNPDGDLFVEERHSYFVREAKTDKVRQIKNRNKDLPLATGDVIRFRGVVGDFSLDSASGEVTEDNIELLAAAEVSVQEDRRMLVMPGHFQDKQLAPNCAPANLEAVLFGSTGNSLRDRMAEVTNGVTSFTGDIAPTITVPYSHTSTNYGSWGSYLLNAAQQAGFDPAQYDHYTYILPTNGTGAGGVANIGGKNNWNYYCNYVGLFMHELGHNIRLAHASTLSNEYGDETSVMGQSYRSWLEYNGPNKHQQGWLPNSKVIDVNSGTYVLSSLDLHPADVSGVQVIRVPKDLTRSEYYYIAYRDGEGSSASLASTYNKKIWVHTWRDDGSFNKSYVQSILAPGNSYNDPATGINISFNEIDTDGNASVSINTVCVPAPATLSVSPQNHSSGGATEKSYTVTVRNNDSSSCAPSSFDVSGTVPVNWNLADNFGVQVISPGAEASGNMLVTPDSAVTTGSYSLSFSIPDVSVAASYEVDTTAPETPTGLQASKKGKRVQLLWNGVTGADEYFVYRNGSYTGRTSNTSYSDSFFNKNGVNTYYVTAVDVAGNESASSTSATYDASSSDGGDTGGGGKTEKCKPWPSCRN